MAALTRCLNYTSQGYRLIDVSNFLHEMVSQPALWRKVVEVAPSIAAGLPAPGDRVALIGCGTSLYVSQAAAAYREARGFGETDAFPASEMPADRHYDLVIAVSRSGTTTEVLQAVGALPAGVPVLAITAAESGPLVELVPNRVELPWADERSVVQTRFATTALALLLHQYGWDVAASAQRAEQALDMALPAHLADARQFVFLGRGVGAAIANEAALKFREILGAWTESYPTREFRHGPISGIGPHSIVWVLDDAEHSIDAAIEETGAHLVRGSGDPLSELVRVHRAAGHLADLKGADPDAPPFLTRSIILDGN